MRDNTTEACVDWVHKIAELQHLTNCDRSACTEEHSLSSYRDDKLQIVEGLVHRSLCIKAESSAVALLMHYSLQLVSKVAGVML